MAKKQIVTFEYTDDLSGDTLTEDQVSTVEFSYGGQDYTIDLSERNAKKLDDFLAPFVDAATRVRKPSTSPTKRSTANTRDLDAVRTWARNNGHEVSDRGRVAQAILDAYDAAS